MEFNFNSIGRVICDQNYRYEAPRQGVFADNSGYIQLSAKSNFEQALEDLQGFDRIWVLYLFHLNSSWKPKVSPPITGDKKKIGLFATRSPHRPNPIGLSCVDLLKVEGLRIHIRNFDMLNGTPVIDIKPYIPMSDSFPASATGWLPEFIAENNWKVAKAVEIEEKLKWVEDKTGLDILSFCSVQLSENPFDASRKRVSSLAGERYSIGYRTWTIFFTADRKNRIIYLQDIKSNYSECDLAPGSEDRYGDKDIHRAFNLL